MAVATPIHIDSATATATAPAGDVLVIDPVAYTPARGGLCIVAATMDNASSDISSVVLSDGSNTFNLTRAFNGLIQFERVQVWYGFLDASGLERGDISVTINASLAGSEHIAASASIFGRVAQAGVAVTPGVAATGVQRFTLDDADVGADDLVIGAFGKNSDDTGTETMSLPIIASAAQANDVQVSVGYYVSPSARPLRVMHSDGGSRRRNGCLLRFSGLSYDDDGHQAVVCDGGIYVRGGAGFVFSRDIDTLDPAGAVVKRDAPRFGRAAAVAAPPASRGQRLLSHRSGTQTQYFVSSGWADADQTHRGVAIWWESSVDNGLLLARGPNLERFLAGLSITLDFASSPFVVTDGDNYARFIPAGGTPGTGTTDPLIQDGDGSDAAHRRYRYQKGTGVLEFGLFVAMVRIERGSGVAGVWEEIGVGYLVIPPEQWDNGSNTLTLSAASHIRQTSEIEEAGAPRGREWAFMNAYHDKRDGTRPERMFFPMADYQAQSGSPEGGWCCLLVAEWNEGSGEWDIGEMVIAIDVNGTTTQDHIHSGGVVFLDDGRIVLAYAHGDGVGQNTVMLRELIDPSIGVYDADQTPGDAAVSGVWGPTIYEGQGRDVEFSGFASVGQQFVGVGPTVRAKIIRLGTDHQQMTISTMEVIDNAIDAEGDSPLLAYIRDDYIGGLAMSGHRGGTPGQEVFAVKVERQEDAAALLTVCTYRDNTGIFDFTSDVNDRTKFARLLLSEQDGPFAQFLAGEFEADNNNFFAGSEGGFVMTGRWSVTLQGIAATPWPSILAARPLLIGPGGTNAAPAASGLTVELNSSGASVSVVALTSLPSPLRAAPFRHAEALEIDYEGSTANANGFILDLDSLTAGANTVVGRFWIANGQDPDDGVVGSVGGQFVASGGSTQVVGGCSNTEALQWTHADFGVYDAGGAGVDLTHNPSGVNPAGDERKGYGWIVLESLFLDAADCGQYPLAPGATGSDERADITGLTQADEWTWQQLSMIGFRGADRMWQVNEALNAKQYLCTLIDGENAIHVWYDVEAEEVVATDGEDDITIDVAHYAARGEGIALSVSAVVGDGSTYVEVQVSCGGQIVRSGAATFGVEIRPTTVKAHRAADDTPCSEMAFFGGRMLPTAAAGMPRDIESAFSTQGATLLRFGPALGGGGSGAVALLTGLIGRGSR